MRGEARPPAVGAPTVSSEPVTAPGTPFAEAVTAEPAGGTSTSQGAEARTATGPGGTRETATKKVATARKKAAAAKATARKSAPAKPAAARTAGGCDACGLLRRARERRGQRPRDVGQRAAPDVPAAASDAAAGRQRRQARALRADIDEEVGRHDAAGKTAAGKTAAKSATAKTDVGEEGRREEGGGEGRRRLGRRPRPRGPRRRRRRRENAGTTVEADLDEEDRILGPVRPDRDHRVGGPRRVGVRGPRRGRRHRPGHRMSERPLCPSPGRRLVRGPASGSASCCRPGPGAPPGGIAGRRATGTAAVLVPAPGGADVAAGGSRHRAQRGRQDG